MSVRPGPWPEVPEQTAVVARAALPKGCLAMRVREELPGLFTDEVFASAFGVRGKPGLSPGSLALVTVLQFTENLTDRQAAEAVRARIDWKYCLGLELTDVGFDHSVLTGFRQRLIDHGLEETVLDALLVRCQELGLLKAGGRQRTDSTHVIAAVRSLNRLELVTETMRAALEALAAAEPGWLAERIDGEWFTRYGARADSYRLPSSKTRRVEAATRTGIDGFVLLEAVHAVSSPAWLRRIPALEALRRVWIANYRRTNTGESREVVWRDDDVPPSSLRVLSPYDTDARYSMKRGHGWEGYKAHFTETCDDVTVTGGPHLITHVATTDATVPDIKQLPDVHRGLDRREVRPGEHLVDSGYVSAETILAARVDGITLTGPVRADSHAKSVFGQACFAVDWDTRQVTCPQGVTSTVWSAGKEDTRGTVVVQFPTATCAICPVRPQCTRSVSSGRQLTLQPRELHDTLEQARAEQKTDEWKQRYATRAGVEGTIHQATTTTGIRRARYRGLAKTHLEHVLAATAINLTRLDAHFTGTPPGRKHTTHLSRLQLQLAA